MDNDIMKDARLKTILQVMASTGIERAADGLSEMIGQKIVMSVPTVTVVPITSVPERVGGAESMVVGIYLASEGEMGGHVMLILAMPDALRLVDLLVGQPEGTATELDALARSALAEAGNLAASFFLNGIAAALGLEGRPSPPAVIVDMAGAILDIMLVTAGELGDDVLLLESVFQRAGRQLKLYFWVLPDLAPLRTLLGRNS
jgi:chemotaxis protein CheC